MYPKPYTLQRNALQVQSDWYMQMVSQRGVLDFHLMFLLQHEHLKPHFDFEITEGFRNPTITVSRVLAHSCIKLGGGWLQHEKGHKQAAWHQLGGQHGQVYWQWG